MSVVVVEAEAAGALRRRTRSLLLPGQRRLHFQKESARRRKELLGELVTFDVSVTVFSCRLQRGQPEPRARAACLSAIVEHLQGLDREVVFYIERREAPCPSTSGRPGLSAPAAIDRPAALVAAGEASGRCHPGDRLKKPQTQPPTVRSGTGFTSSGPGPSADLSMALKSRRAIPSHRLSDEHSRSLPYPSSPSPASIIAGPADPPSITPEVEPRTCTYGCGSNPGSQSVCVAAPVRRVRRHGATSSGRAVPGSASLDDAAHGQGGRSAPGPGPRPPVRMSGAGLVPLEGGRGPLARSDSHTA
jgi:hypothetical protein